MDFTLAVQPPFSLQSVLRSHGWIQLAPFVGEDPYQEFNYANQLDSGRTTSWHVQPEEDGLRVTVEGELSGLEEAEIGEKLTWMLGLDRDLSSFYAVASQEPKLAHVVDKVEGRILRSSSFFEDTVKTILTTNTALATLENERALLNRIPTWPWQPESGPSTCRTATWSPIARSSPSSSATS